MHSTAVLSAVRVCVCVMCVLVSLYVIWNCLAGVLVLADVFAMVKNSELSDGECFENVPQKKIYF